MRHLFLVFLIFISGPLVSAQSDSSAALISQGRELIESWDNLQDQNSRIYHKYLLILEYVGPIQFAELDFSTLSERNGQLVQLNEESRQRIHDFIRSYDPKNFKGPEKEIARRTRAIGTQMLTFLTTMDALSAAELVRLYESDGYSVRRSLKTRMYHLGPEMLNFAAAIVIVRIATCFGGSPQNVIQSITTWQTPSMVASKTDTVCMDEIIDMLKSPIFYVGFTAFIAGSSVANSLTLQALQKFDPDRGPRTRAFERNWLPNIALAVGFMADHFVKTLIQNPYLFECGKIAVPKMLGSAIGTVIAHETLGDEEFEVRDFFGGFREPTCRRAFFSISSDQYLKHELGVGLTSLVATATVLAKGTQAVGWMNAKTGATARLSRGARILSAAMGEGATAVRLRKFTVAVSMVAGGPVGFAIRGAHTLLFFALWEVMGPYIEQMYMEGLVKADVDSYTRQFAQAVGRFSPEEFPLLQGTPCSVHYTGEQENGNLRICSRLPILSYLYTFHDYSRTWREKHILKDFFEAHGRWTQKLTSYINNYLMSFRLLNVLTRTREMYLNYRSLLRADKKPQDIRYQDYLAEGESAVLKKLEDKIQAILLEIPDEQERQAFLQEVEEDFHRQQQGDYESPFSKAPHSNPGRQIFDALDEISYRQYLVEILPFGYPFQGINGQGHFPETQELDELASEVMDFIGDPEDENFSYIEIVDYRESNYNMITDHSMAELLLQLGMPLEFAYRPKQMDIIRYYLMIPDPVFNAIGLMLFQEWAPMMRGPYQGFQTPPDADGEYRYNPQGLHPRQWPLYEKITAALEHYTPILPWEMHYIVGTYGELPSREKTTIDGQFDEVSHQLQSKSLADFSLTQLICGQNGSYRNLFGDNGGVALQFAFPKLIEGDLCDNIVHKIHMAGEDSPSPLRSLFVNEKGVYLGLHQSYIRHPEDPSNPLLFSKEQEAGDWWNRDVLPPSIRRLQDMRVQLDEAIAETFTTRLSDIEIENEGWWAYAKSLIGRFFGGQSDQDRLAQRSTSTESLTLSLINEFYHYRAGLQHILAPEEYSALEKDLMEAGQCIVKMVNSIPEKKYRVVRQGCENSIDNVKFALKARNGKYNSEDAQAIIRVIPEEDLDQEQRRDRVIIEFSDKISSLFGEIERYNQMINESFNFALEEGETL